MIFVKIFNGEKREIYNLLILVLYFSIVLLLRIERRKMEEREKNSLERESEGSWGGRIRRGER